MCGVVCCVFRALYEGSYLSNRARLVVVTINYRLGAFGFFNGNTDGGSFGGNQGLKDQRLALQWVQSNIKLFGGAC